MWLSLARRRDLLLAVVIVVTILTFLCAIFNSLGLAPEGQVDAYLYIQKYIYTIYI